MKLSSALVAALVGLATAHDSDGSHHLPKILGGRKFLSEMRMRRSAAVPEPIVNRKPLESPHRGSGPRRRQDDEEPECGPGVGSCAAGVCCSADG